MAPGLDRWHHLRPRRWRQNIPLILQAEERMLIIMAMYARISTLEGPPDQIDEWLRYLRGNVLPQLKQQDGFKGMAALADRQTGKTLGVAFWESEEALRASEEAANSLRDRKSTRLNSSHANISYAVFCLKKKKI